MSAREKDVKRRISYLGLPVNIEIEKGETRGGVGEDGEKWEKTYGVPYGEIDQTIALSDGDPVDVYLGPREDLSAKVYVIHQLRKNGEYDEDKVMLGFPSENAAIESYQRHGPPWGFGSVDEMTLDQFVNGYLAANRAHQAGPLHNTATAREAAGKARYGTP